MRVLNWQLHWTNCGTECDQGTRHGLRRRYMRFPGQLNYHNANKDKSVQYLLLSEFPAATHIAHLAVVAEHNAQRSSPSRVAGVAIVSRLSLATKLYPSS